ncbi:MAG: D-alanyl-D-alanine carboxypeptidase/D-alanyl-D-alanine-endopeptidase [Armatimonadota bacterium]
MLQFPRPEGGRPRRGARQALLLFSAALLLAARAGADTASLAQRVDAAIAGLGPHTLSAVRVVELPQGDVLYERNADLSMNPASNMKLLTSAAALAHLGPDYRFTTRVLQTGKRSGSTLAGDLILQGGGDPVLETKDLERLADAVKAGGIRVVTGALRVDDSRYDRRRLGTGWEADDESYYYAAQVSALSVNSNVMKVDVLPAARAGAPVTVKQSPIPGYAALAERPLTGSADTKSDLDVMRLRGRNALKITGTIGVGGRPLREVEVTVEEPQRFAGALFRQLLAQRGVKVAGPVRDLPAPDSARALTSLTSPPLSRLVSLLNKPSNNLIAEMLLKEIGYREKGKGDTHTGSEVLEDWLAKLGVPAGGVLVNDGSGMSRHDLVTARAVSELLVKARAQPWGPVFTESLPVMGVDGTLRSRLKGTSAEGKIQAKTGTLSHVTALSGYATSRDGKRRVFSILINHHPGPTGGANGAKRAEDAIALALVEE